jgi:hypothetical protein
VHEQVLRIDNCLGEVVVLLGEVVLKVILSAPAMNVTAMKASFTACLASVISSLVEDAMVVASNASADTSASSPMGLLDSEQGFRITKQPMGSK